MYEMNLGRLEDKRIQLRVGVHAGDAISQKDVYGGAVKVASRIHPLAMSGDICITEQVNYQGKNKFEFPLLSIGKKELKNLGEPTEVFRVVLPWEQSTAKDVATFPTNRIATCHSPTSVPARMASILPMGTHGQARREADTWVELSQKWFPYVKVGGDVLAAAGESDKEAVRKLMPDLGSFLGSRIRFLHGC